MTPNKDAKRAAQRTSLAPLTFDEALAGLLATEPPSEKQKAQRKATRATTTPKSKSMKGARHMKEGNHG